MSDMVIISAGFKHAPFIERAFKLNNHFRERNFGYPFKIWIDDYPEGFDIETMNPYLIKYYCMKEMIKEGYTKILWMDSSVRFWNSPDSISNILDIVGSFLIQDGNEHNLNEFSNDNFIETLKLTREEAKQIKIILGTVFGININSNYGSKIWQLYKLIAENHPSVFDGHRFKDTNKEVKGHRNDQSVLSYICHMVGATPTQETSVEGPWYYHNQYLRNQRIDGEDHISNPNVGYFPSNAVLVSSDVIVGERPWDK
tara:strand:- start:339 stop:1106 length:768 start_codon:yes stop_codon:yes gene_type:complete